jgi:hypothetical protein
MRSDSKDSTAPLLTCEVTGVSFPLPPEEQIHLERMGDLGGLLPGRLPYPRVHPYEAWRQVFSYAHLMYLYRLPSAHSGKIQLTRYNPALGYKICTLDEFNTQEIDNTDVGRPYDFSKPFFVQFDELMHAALHPPLNSTNVEQSDFINGGMNVKNSYLSFNIVDSQDCLYCISQYNGNDNLYCIQTNHCQFCYRCVNTDHCYECQHCLVSNNCSQCFACYDCIGCSQCVGCCGLRNVRYAIFNEPGTRESYDEFIQKTNLGNYNKHEELLTRCRKFIASQNPRTEFLINTENCSGNYLRSSKNLVQCYFAGSSEDCGYLGPANNAKDCWRGWGMNTELAYFSGSMRSRWVAYSYSLLECESCIYCYHCYNRCAYCFGCVGLRHKSYCILNRQYSRREFAELVPRIVKHMQETGQWGQFFPPRISPYDYRESGAPDMIDPLPDAELRRRGYRFENLPRVSPAVDALDAKLLPDDIREVAADDLTGRPVRCESSGLAFNYQHQELKFYKRLGIPLPRKHWRVALSELLNERTKIPALQACPPWQQSCEEGVNS